MPLITDWLMVVITFVYVVATIFICWANIKSAKASKEELAEMKRQYADEKRPRIEIEFCYERRTWYIVRFINHGRLTAQHVKIILDEEFIDSLPGLGFQDTLRKQRKKELIIGVGQHYDLYIASNELRGNPNMKPVTGKISYQNDKETFKSDIFVDLASYAPFFSSTSEEENIQKELKNIKKEIEGVKFAIKASNVSKEEDKKDV